MAEFIMSGRVSDKSHSFIREMTNRIIETIEAMNERGVLAEVVIPQIPDEHGRYVIKIKPKSIITKE